MSKVFPTDNKMGFIVCDSIRPEVGGKVSLLGYCATPHLTVEMPDLANDTIGGLALAVAFVLYDGEGTFSGKIEMKDPNGTVLGMADLDAIVKAAGDPNITYINIPMLPISSMGNYTATLTLENTRNYSRTITIDKK
jgi:hypothetical protein